MLPTENLSFIISKKSKPLSGRAFCKQKLGNAVTRNSIKRKIRHVLLEFSPHLQPYDFVIIARKGVEELDYHEVKKNLLHVLKIANLYQEGLTSEKKL